MPISRVRSVTDTSMMFMMPMPPTSSEMPTMPATTSVIVLDDLLEGLRERVGGLDEEIVRARRRSRPCSAADQRRSPAASRCRRASGSSTRSVIQRSGCAMHAGDGQRRLVRHQQEESWFWPNTSPRGSMHADDLEPLAADLHELAVGSLGHLQVLAHLLAEHHHAAAARRRRCRVMKRPVRGNSCCTSWKLRSCRTTGRGGVRAVAHLGAEPRAGEHDRRDVRDAIHAKAQLVQIGRAAGG